MHEIVVPAQAGTQFDPLDARLRGHDGIAFRGL